jgi:hypothetical protein
MSQESNYFGAESPSFHPDKTFEEYLSSENLLPEKYKKEFLAEHDLGSPYIYSLFPLNLLPFSEKRVENEKLRIVRSAEEKIISQAKAKGAVAVVECEYDKKDYPTNTMDNAWGIDKYMCNIWAYAVVPVQTGASI